jgi:xanthine dehydrogenase accessory factor
MNDLPQLLAFRDRYQAVQTPLLLVTVVHTAGSTYRKPGARLLLTPEGQHEGTISGGCLEADLIETAWSRLEKNQGQPVIMQYDTTKEGEIFWGTGTGCGGQVDLLLELLQNDDPLAFVAEVQSARERAVVITVLESRAPSSGFTVRSLATGARFYLRQGQSINPQRSDLELLAEIQRLGEKTLAEKRSWLAECKLRSGEEIDFFCEFVSVPNQLFLFGTGRDALPIVQIAKSLGWKVTVAGKRATTGAAAQLETLADTFLTVGEALSLVRSDSLVLVMNHNFLDDLSVLENLSGRWPCYVGLLGPRNRKDKLVSELARNASGWDRRQLDRLYAPAGLDLGVEGPAGIALSIVAEMQSVLSGRSAAQLRFRKSPIYSDFPSDLTPIGRAAES